MEELDKRIIQLVPNYFEYDFEKLVLAYQNYIKRPKKKASCSFEDLLKEFSEGRTYASIAKTYGISRERVRQIYNESFAGLFDKYNSGWDRIHKVRDYKERTDLLNTPAFKIWTTVFNRVGLPYDLARGVAPTTLFLKNIAIVNGWKCRLYNCESIIRQGRRLYSRVIVTNNILDEHDFLLICRTRKNQVEYFIVPTSVVPHTSGTNPKNLYIPFDLETTQGMAVYWLEYLNDWGRLKQFKGEGLSNQSQ